MQYGRNGEITEEFTRTKNQFVVIFVRKGSQENLQLIAIWRKAILHDLNTIRTCVLEFSKNDIYVILFYYKILRITRNQIVRIYKTNGFMPLFQVCTETWSAICASKASKHTRNSRSISSWNTTVLAFSAQNVPKRFFGNIA